MRVGFGRLTAVIAGCGLALATGAGAALAHVDPDPPAVEAGRTVTVAFNVEHGCNGSPTKKLEFQVPTDVTDAQPVAKDGWATDVANGVVSFTGNLDATTPDSFSIAFTAPTTPGTIHFPVVQTCAVGETAWIEIAVDGAPEPDHPAPAILVTQGPPTSAELAPMDDSAMDSTMDSTMAAGTDTTTTTTTAAATADSAAATTAPTANSTPVTAVIAPAPATTVAPAGSGDSSNTGLVIGIIVAVVVVGGGAAFVVIRKRNIQGA